MTVEMHLRIDLQKPANSPLTPGSRQLPTINPMVQTLEQRLLQVEVAYNVRHLGGYQTSDGRITRPDIIRAGSLHRLNDAGAMQLAGLGITTVFDLRSENERTQMATPELLHHGIRLTGAAVFEQDASPVALAEGFPGFEIVYREMLTNGRNAYRTMFEQLALSSGGFLFHCAAGKDRTGIGAALLLELAGVRDEEIIEDYAHSSALIRDAFKDWLPPAGTPVIDPSVRERMFASDPEDMEATLQYIRGRWGSARGYMLMWECPQN